MTGLERTSASNQGANITRCTFYLARRMVVPIYWIRILTSMIMTKTIRVLLKTSTITTITTVMVAAISWKCSKPICGQHLWVSSTHNSRRIILVKEPNICGISFGLQQTDTVEALSRSSLLPYGDSDYVRRFVPGEPVFETKDCLNEQKF